MLNCYGCWKRYKNNTKQLNTVIIYIDGRNVKYKRTYYCLVCLQDRVLNGMGLTLIDFNEKL